ncbi:MAG: 3-phosphoserine/phosphohydroxythreonine transaminase [Rhodocyclaceae bacterium]
MSRIWNFSAGPAVLPAEVLEQVKDELLDWHGAGCGVMEMSHRGKEFTSIIAAAEADLRELLGIPANYKVLFLQGGATQQFAQIPLNLLPAGKSADYLVTGSWSKKAVKEAQRVTAGLASVRVAGTTEAAAFTRNLDDGEIVIDPNAAYVHLCTNETIHGLELDCSRLPQTTVPIVADMSSHILSRPVDVSKYALIYAGAQKNIGPSGVTIVIVREDLLGRAPATIPTVMDYAVMAENGSMLNTPPTFAIYVSGLVFKWLKRLGGLAEVEKINAHKAELLYACIDGSEDFYRNPVRVADRSRMNVPFTLANAELDAAFLAESKAVGLASLKGHKSVGGMRASIYNAMPTDGVRTLVEFMQDFQRRKA